MKSILKTLVILAITVTVKSSEGQSFQVMLDSALANFDTAQTLPGRMQTSAALDLLANQYSGEWSANYYAAYAKAMTSFVETDAKKRDMLLDEADNYMSKISVIPTDSSEKYILLALIANARIAVDGQNRWREYGTIFDQNLQKAKTLNAENPRIYYLKGLSLFYTPKMFGGGKKRAKVYFDKATLLFDKEDKTSIQNPYWGFKQNKIYTEKCLSK